MKTHLLNLKHSQRASKPNHSATVNGRRLRTMLMEWLLWWCWQWCHWKGDQQSLRGQGTAQQQCLRGRQAATMKTKAVSPPNLQIQSPQRCRLWRGDWQWCWQWCHWMKEVSGASEAKEEDGSGVGADGRRRWWKWRPQHLQSGRYKARNAAVDGQGACDDINGGAAGWRRSAEPPRPRRRTAAAGCVLSHLDQSDDDNVELKIKTKVNSNCKIVKLWNCEL
jgi:hypothetical protein